MGKKIKKEENVSPPDAFDPAIIETKQSATVVSLLNSPEFEVQTSACAAIFQFVLKCEENQKQLIDLGAINGLIPLLQSIDREVRRNSVMALAVLSQHPEARRQMRRSLEQVLVAILALLRAGGHPAGRQTVATTREFAAWTLSNLASEGALIPLILEKEDSLPLLVEALNDEDPDLQNHAVSCLASMLQDATVRPALLKTQALSSLLDMIESSEHVLIQEKALLCLIRAAFHSQCQAALNELSTFTTLTNLLAQPKYNNLHVLAVHVLANCARLSANHRSLRESGALLALLNFVKEPEVGEEEAGGNKNDKNKKKGGASAKKKKGEEDKKDDEKLQSHLNPEVKMHAARGLGFAMQCEDNRRMLHDAEIERRLVILLGHDDELVRVAAVGAIAVLAENSDSQESVIRAEGIEPLLKMVKSDHVISKECGTLALANLTLGNVAASLFIASHNGIELLIASISNENEFVITNALKTLCNMASDEFCRNKALTLGLTNALMTSLVNSSALVRSHAALLVANFYTDSEQCAELVAKGALEPLLDMLQDNHASVRNATCQALSFLCSDAATAKQLIQMRLLELLLNLCESQTKCNHFTEDALNRLLSHNLTAKYAYIGHLSATDRIPNDFYDMGQLKRDCALLTLAEYDAEPVNNRRPILWIHLKPIKEDVVGPATNGADVLTTSATFEENHESSGVTVDNDAESALKTSTVSMTRQSATASTVFVPVDDVILAKYISDSRELLLPISNTIDQVIALARFVSERMGGSVAHSQLSDFGYELAAAELKFAKKSNVLPLGLIQIGIHYHRALLFKLLADRVGLFVTLERGEYNRAWNRVRITTGINSTTALVDLMHEPGRLLLENSAEALIYTRL